MSVFAVPCSPSMSLSCLRVTERIQAPENVRVSSQQAPVVFICTTSPQDAAAAEAIAKAKNAPAAEIAARKEAVEADEAAAAAEKVRMRHCSSPQPSLGSHLELPVTDITCTTPRAWRPNVRCHCSRFPPYRQVPFPTIGLPQPGSTVARMPAVLPRQPFPAAF